MKNFEQDLTRYLVLNTDTINQINVIKWWESRRITYNGVLIIITLLSLKLRELISLPYADSDAAFIYVFVTLFILIIANVTYTLGWVLLLIVKALQSKGSWLHEFIKYLYIITLLISSILAITAVLCSSLN